ncbi:FAD-dependent monooxygenase [Apiospora hydei]|uniref:FAD-dependent monooxygenase n=1 Tax=Apiospora hydei TaxID=1337664 RepID=A0ABR1XA37_9PEZI
MSSLTVHLFPLISVLGLYAVSSYMTYSGLAAAFAESQANPMRLLPDGHTPLLTSYTGLAPLDSYLANLQYIFVPVVDGASAELSLLGWHWGSLLLPLFTVMLGEGLRTGRSRDLVFFELWGLAIQYCGYFVTMPIYCYVYLLSSSSQSRSTTVSATAARMIPISTLVGYVFPTVVMSLSSLHSGQSRQVAVAFWQNFPVWVATIQWALMWGSSSMPTADDAPSKAASHSTNMAFGNVLSRIYRAVALISGLMHVAGLVPIVLATFFPEHLIALSPMHLDSSTLQSLQGGNFFLPPKWDSRAQITGMAEGGGELSQSARGKNASNGKKPLSGRGGWLAGTGLAQGLMIALTTLVLGPGYTIASLMV